MFLLFRLGVHEVPVYLFFFFLFLFFGALPVLSDGLTRVACFYVTDGAWIFRAVCFSTLLVLLFLFRWLRFRCLSCGALMLRFIRWCVPSYVVLFFLGVRPSTLRKIGLFFIFYLFALFPHIRCTYFLLIAIVALLNIARANEYASYENL